MPLQKHRNYLEPLGIRPDFLYKEGMTPSEEWVPMAEAARMVGKTPPAIAYHVRAGRIRSKQEQIGARTARLVSRQDLEKIFGPPAEKPSSASMDHGAGEPEVLRAELEAVRAHLEDVRKERDRLLEILARERTS
ncbi:MAG: hypothetical protein U0V56_01585 [Actinomycetota bacterium]